MTKNRIFMKRCQNLNKCSKFSINQNLNLQLQTPLNSSIKNLRRFESIKSIKRCRLKEVFQDTFLIQVVMMAIMFGFSKQLDSTEAEESMFLTHLRKWNSRLLKWEKVQRKNLRRKSKSKKTLICRHQRNSKVVHSSFKNILKDLFWSKTESLTLDAGF